MGKPDQSNVAEATATCPDGSRVPRAATPGNPDPGRPQPATRWWQWATVLSLDAPAVALAWQWLLARVADTSLRWVHPVVLGASIWLGYVADRWLEATRSPSRAMLTARHRFYHRHRRGMAIVWVMVLVVDVALATAGLSRRELVGGLLLLGPVLAYVLLHQSVAGSHHRRSPKEVWVAGLLGSGAVLFAVIAPGARLDRLALPFALFVLLCFTNCALISVWERDVDSARGQVSFARQFRRGAVVSRRLPWILAAVAGAGILLTPGAPSVACACACASSILLALVDAMQPRLGWQAARVLADGALLTPLVAWLAASSHQP